MISQVGGNGSFLHSKHDSRYICLQCSRVIFISAYSQIEQAGIEGIFTKNFQLDLQGLLSGAVLGHTLIGALVIEADPLNPEGCSVLGSNRKSIVKPADLGAWFSLDHTWESHRLANQGFQEGRCGLNSGFS